MKNEFKAGDLVFEGVFFDEIVLSVLKPFDNGKYTVEGSLATYTREGFNSVHSTSLTKIFHANPENRQALVTLYGEDAVPKLPLRGSELTKKLLEKQKYVLCLVSHTSDDKARSNNPPKVRTVAGVDRDWFESVTGLMNEYAVPIDNNGNEITEIE